MTTIERNCKDCQQPFTIEAGEREYFEARGLTLPLRCRPCRDFRKRERLEAAHS